MFFSLLIFVASLIVEFLILFFSSPDNPDGEINHFFVILFSLNTGVLFGALYSLLLILVYWFLQAYHDLYERIFIRRSIFFGIFVFLIVLLKLYAILDFYLIMGMIVVFFCVEIITSYK